MKRLGRWLARADARTRAASWHPTQGTALRGSVAGGVVVLLGTLLTAPTSDALFQVGGTASQTELVSSVNPSVVGQTVTYKAKVSDDPDDSDAGLGVPTGTVDFVQGDNPLCEDVVLNAVGEATCSATHFSTGRRTIEATYSGDPNFSASTAELTQDVNRAKTATTLSSSDGDNKTVSGQTVTYTARVTAVSPGTGVPDGTVAFKDGDTTITGCGAKTLDAGVARCVTKLRVGRGTHAITATYAGNAKYVPSTSNALIQTVSQAGTQAELSSSKNPAFSTEKTTYTARVKVLAPGTGPATGRVVFKDGGRAMSSCGGSTGQSLRSGVAKCSVDNSRVGTHTITAHYVGNSNFKADTSNAVSQVFKYLVRAWISSGSTSDPDQASFLISGKPAKDYRLCVKYDDAWPATTPPPVNGATRYTLNLNYKCTTVSWGRGLNSVRGMAGTFGFATKGRYRATWSVDGVQAGTDTFSWNSWCPPKGLRDIGVWRPSRLKTIDSCKSDWGKVAREGTTSGLDKDFGWAWAVGSRRIHVEYVARDHYYSNPTTGNANLLPNPGGVGAEWTLWGNYQCDTYHGWKEFHAVYMARKGDSIYITGPQYSTKTPSVSGTWSAHTC